MRERQVRSFGPRFSPVLYACCSGRRGRTLTELPVIEGELSCPRRRHAATLSLEQLLEAVDRLPPAQKREFERRWPHRSDSGEKLSDQANLVRAAKMRLTAADDRRLKRVISRRRVEY